MLSLGLIGAALMLVAVGKGALAASFAVSGTSFKVSADRLQGEGFVQFGWVDQGADAAHPVAVSGFRSVVLDNFCQSVLLRSLPVVGDVTLRLTSDGPAGMTATDIVLGVSELSGDLTLTNPDIGVDAAQFTAGPPDVKGQPGAFGQQAEQTIITAPRLSAWSTGAHTLRLKNFKLEMRGGAAECH